MKEQDLKINVFRSKAFLLKHIDLFLYNFEGSNYMSRHQNKLIIIFQAPLLLYKHFYATRMEIVIFHQRKHVSIFQFEQHGE